MHLVYFDADGLKKKDPVTVVCGISVGDDAQWRSAYDNINYVITLHVPKEVRDEFGYFTSCASCGTRPSTQTAGLRSHAALSCTTCSTSLSIPHWR